jgi:hypothetical protein
MGLGPLGVPIWDRVPTYGTESVHMGPSLYICDSALNITALNSIQRGESRVRRRSWARARRRPCSACAPAWRRPSSFAAAMPAPKQVPALLCFEPLGDSRAGPLGRTIDYSAGR